MIRSNQHQQQRQQKQQQQGWRVMVHSIIHHIRNYIILIVVTIGRTGIGRKMIQLSSSSLVCQRRRLKIIIMRIIIILLLCLLVVVLLQNQSTSNIYLMDNYISSIPISSYSWIPTFQTSQYQCAPWLTNRKQRRIAFIDLSNMKKYYTRHKKMYRGGEFYMSASLEYALIQNGFHVDIISVKHLIQKNYHELYTILSKYHRIFATGIEVWIQLNTSSQLLVVQQDQNQQDTDDIICKLRSIHWWGNSNENEQMKLIPFDPKQYLKPYPTADYYNAFLGYFPHSTILFPTTTGTKRQQQRTTSSTSSLSVPKVGLLLGKVMKSFRNSKSLIQALLDDGFILHTTCTECYDLMNNTSIQQHLPHSDRIVYHTNVSPYEYIQLLQQCSFLLGLGHPYDSPSPIEALANGVAFINPIAQHVFQSNTNETIFPFHTTTTTNPRIRTSQHVPIQMLGIPYVYNVHLNNIQQVVDAANHAVQYRFVSFVPYEYHPITHTRRVCAMMEDDTICTCPKYNSKNNNKVDCRGSTTIRKPYTGHDANGVGDIHFY